MFWRLTIVILSFFCFFIANMLVFALQCCKKKKSKKAGKRRGESNRPKRDDKIKSAESMKKDNKKDATPDDVNDKTPKASASSKVDNMVKSKEDDDKKKSKEEKEVTALSSELPSKEKTPTSKTKTKSVFTGVSTDDTTTPTTKGTLIEGEKKVSAVLTALTEMEKTKLKEREEERKFPLEEAIDDNPDYDTLQYADKKDVFKTGFTSKGVRIVKEETKTMKLKPGDSAYLDA